MADLQSRLTLRSKSSARRLAWIGEVNDFTSRSLASTKYLGEWEPQLLRLDGREWMWCQTSQFFIHNDMFYASWNCLWKVISNTKSCFLDCDRLYFSWANVVVLDTSNLHAIWKCIWLCGFEYSLRYFLYKNPIPSRRTHIRPQKFPLNRLDPPRHQPAYQILLGFCIHFRYEFRGNFLYNEIKSLFWKYVWAILYIYEFNWSG